MMMNVGINLRNLIGIIFVLLAAGCGGMLPILIILPERIWFVSREPAHPGFWGLVSLSAIAGTMTVYLYYVWLEYRRSAQDKQPSLAQYLK